MSSSLFLLSCLIVFLLGWGRSKITLAGLYPIWDGMFRGLNIFLCDHQELPVVWFLAVAWSSMWESRKLSRGPELYRIRADLEAKVSLLRETRQSESAAENTPMISKL